jgi:hypothetical protein
MFDQMEYIGFYMNILNNIFLCNEQTKINQY